MNGKWFLAVSDAEDKRKRDSAKFRWNTISNLFLQVTLNKGHLRAKFFTFMTFNLYFLHMHVAPKGNFTTTLKQKENYVK